MGRAGPHKKKQFPHPLPIPGPSTGIHYPKNPVSDTQLIKTSVYDSLRPDQIITNVAVLTIALAHVNMQMILDMPNTHIFPHIQASTHLMLILEKSSSYAVDA